MTLTTARRSDSLPSLSYQSPFGALTLVASARGLRAILWPGDDPARAGLADIRFISEPTSLLDEAAHQLEAYFQGTRTAFDVPLDLQGTAFQLATWRELIDIPYGETRTYGALAARLGTRTGARAVGAANGRNPVSIVVPCHRVVGGDGALRGFAGGLPAKAALLALERRPIPV